MKLSEHSPTVFVEIRFLKGTPHITGVDMKRYGPFKKGDVAALPKGTALALIKKGVAEKRYPPAEKPTLKQKMKGEVLNGYLERARAKPLVEEETKEKGELKELQQYWLKHRGLKKRLFRHPTKGKIYLAKHELVRELSCHPEDVEEVWESAKTSPISWELIVEKHTLGSSSNPKMHEPKKPTTYNRELWSELVETGKKAEKPPKITHSMTPIKES